MVTAADEPTEEQWWHHWEQCALIDAQAGEGHRG